MSEECMLNVSAWNWVDQNLTHNAQSGAECNRDDCDDNDGWLFTLRIRLGYIYIRHSTKPMPKHDCTSSQHSLMALCVLTSFNPKHTIRQRATCVPSYGAWSRSSSSWCVFSAKIQQYTHALHCLLCVCYRCNICRSRNTHREAEMLWIFQQVFETTCTLNLFSYISTLYMYIYIICVNLLK